MADPKKTVKAKKPPTPQQQEIAALRNIGKDKRTDQQSARLDQLVKSEKRARFLRVAPKRVQKAMDALATVSACGNANNYTYTEEEAARVMSALIGSLKSVEEAFSKRKEERERFSF